MRGRVGTLPTTVGPSSLLPVFISGLSGTQRVHHLFLSVDAWAAAAELTCCKSLYGPRRLN